MAFIVGLTRTQARAIMASQVARAERLDAADDVIDNSQDLTHLRRQLDALHARYLQLASSAG